MESKYSLDRILEKKQSSNSDPKKFNGVAAVLSFFIPGLGQIYKGSVFTGLLWFFLVFMGYLFLIIPGIILHIFCIVFAGDDSRP